MEQVLTPRFWVANRVSLRSVDLLFRVASASVLNDAARNRFIHGGIPAGQLAATLRRVRGVRGWSVAWAHAARDYAAKARRAERSGNHPVIGTNLANAALCFHFGQIFEHGNVQRKRRLYLRSAALFRQAAPLLDPPAELVEIPWREIALPGYLRRPAGSDGRQLPLLVILNGASTVKEETIRWTDPFISRGFATLALDTPGSGEAWERALGRPGQEDIADALLSFSERRAGIDPDRVAVLGISLRGALAVQLAARRDRLAAAIAVTAPFDPTPYLRHLNRLVVGEISFLTGLSRTELIRSVHQMALTDVVPQVRVPLLVIGAGRDMVVPPEESLRLYAAADGPKQLLFYDDANHVGFSHMADWLSDTADWLAETVQTRRHV